VHDCDAAMGTQGSWRFAPPRHASQRPRKARGGGCATIPHQTTWSGCNMASYVDQVLTKDERVVHVGHISLWSLSGHIILGALLLFVFGLGLIVWASAFIKYKTTELAITNKRVIAKFGFISRRTIEINLNKVESLQVD